AARRRGRTFARSDARSDRRVAGAHRSGSQNLQRTSTFARGEGGLRSFLRTQAVTSMSLKGKTLFITGASRGIGLAIARRAACDGANIAIAAKTEIPHPKLEGTIHSAAEAIEQAGSQAPPLVVDVRDEAAVKGAIAKTVPRFGPLDMVVNNASAISLTPVAQTDMKRFDLMHQINARGTFMVSKYAIALWERAKTPHILMLPPPLDMAEKWFAPY